MGFRMKVPYHIEISASQNYPFKLPKSGQYSFFVKVQHKFTQPYHEFEKNIHNKIIKIKEVTQSYIHESITIFYQYIPYPIHHSSELFQNYLQDKKYLQDLQQIFAYLIENGIQPSPKLQNFGFTEAQQLKYYQKPSLKLIDHNIGKERKQQMIQELISNFEEELSNTVRSNNAKCSLMSKIGHLEQKFNKIKQNYLKSKQSQSPSSEYESFENNQSSYERSKNKSQQLSQKQNNYSQSYSLREPRKQRRRSSSFKLSQRNKTKSEHKSSWEGTLSSFFKDNSGSTVIHEDEDKTTILRNRISQALMKTQKTLKKYEKASKKSRSKKRN